MNIFNGIDSARLQTIIKRFSQQRIAVLGDYFLDKYLEFDPKLDEPSVETGKPAHQVVDVRCCPGAAGTVVSNLAALGARQLHAVGFTGEDGEGFELRRGLQALGCATTHLHCDRHRRTPTYLKPRDITQPGLAGEASRYDTKNRMLTSSNTIEQIISSVEGLLGQAPQIDAMIILDQVAEADCGVVTAKLREAISQLAKQHPEVVFWADSRQYIREFRHVTIKVNQFEAVGWENPPVDAVVDFDRLLPAIETLKNHADAPVFVTRGSEGMIVADGDLAAVAGIELPGPTDPTGAGDSATAGAVLALASGASPVEAALIGNLVASITIQQLGTTGTANPSDLPERLEIWHCQQGE